MPGIPNNTDMRKALSGAPGAVPGAMTGVATSMIVGPQIAAATLNQQNRFKKQ